MAKDVLNCSKLDDDSQRIFDCCTNGIQQNKGLITFPTQSMCLINVIWAVSLLYDPDLMCGVIWVLMTLVVAYCVKKDLKRGMV